MQKVSLEILSVYSHTDKQPLTTQILYIEYVTWEIAPGRLADGSVVDVWGRKHNVEWDMPGTGAPCTSTAR